MQNIQHPLKISVAGAGIMGLMSAYTLARNFPQASITLHDPCGFPAQNASFMAGGMITPYSEIDHIPETFLPAGLESIKIWTQIAQEKGADFEFTQNGSLLIAHEQDHHLLERFRALLPHNGLWKITERAEISRIEENLAKNNIRYGLYIEGEAHLSTRKTLEFLSNFIIDKKETEIDPQNHSAHCDWVIDCRGIAASAEHKDLRGVKGEILIVHNPEFSLSRPVRLMHPRYPLYIVPRVDNIFLIGATIIESNDNTDVSIRSGLELMSALYSLHPSFADARILEMRAGIRPAYPDNMPRITVRGNIISCNGLYRHGYLFSPVMAQGVADYIAGRHNPFLPLFLKDTK